MIVTHQAQRPAPPRVCSMQAATFEATALDEFLTGFRQLLDIIHAITARPGARPALMLISGGRM